MARVDHDLTPEQWHAILAAWGGCAYCGADESSLQRDCVLPISRGGRYTLDNVVPACRSCNASKCNQEVTAWLRRKRLDERAFLARHLATVATLAPARHDGGVDALTAVGLGLAHGTVGLHRTTEGWLVAGSGLREEVAALLDGMCVDVEQIGSSSVVGLLAKPIVDLAVGLAAGQDVPPVTSRLVAAGWIYRGDAGDDGGHVFVLESRPWYRVAHLHVVEHDGAQWRDYLGLRDLLRRSPEARVRYEAVKLQLSEQHRHDRAAYTNGKSDVVRALLGIGERGIDRSR